MVNIKLTIEFDGTAYHGWQSQENAGTVQDTIEAAIEKITGEHSALTGAGRTDAGVHAIAFAANFRTSSRIPPERFSFALNSVLPDDISIIRSEVVNEDFHSRFSSTGKKYRYLICNTEHKPAIMRNRACHVSGPLNVSLMKEAAQHFVGTFDFSAFMATGSCVENTVRTIRKVSLEKQGELIVFEIEGSGFQYNMVRIIVGTLIEVGRGKIPPGAISNIISGKNRNNAGKTAVASGLYLVEVYY
jgi:tRNA pseudouridine38-40 synthase